jgi:hypothetical protein
MQKSHLITTRKDGVRVMIKVKGPEVFEILDKVGLLLKRELTEQRKVLAQI